MKGNKWIFSRHLVPLDACQTEVWTPDHCSLITVPRLNDKKNLQGLFAKPRRFVHRVQSTLYLSSCNFASAAARRAIGTRGAEQDT